MSLKDFFKKITKKPQQEMQKALLKPLGYEPLNTTIFQQRDIWQCDAIQQAVSRIVQELLKYRPTHSRTERFDEKYSIKSNIQRLLDYPNTWDSAQDVFERLFYQYFLNGNAYLIPTFFVQGGKRVYTGLYNISPVETRHIDFADGSEGYYFAFASGYAVQLHSQEVIHIKRNYYKNDFFGGDQYGRQDSQALKETVKINDRLLSGVADAIDSTYGVNAILRYDTMLDAKQQEVYRDQFFQQLKSSQGQGAFLITDNKMTFEPIEHDRKLIDPETLKFIDSKILRTYGVSSSILDGTYTPEELKAFINTAVEPVLEKVEAELTRKLFSQSELEHGNEIVFYRSDLRRYLDSSTVEVLGMLREIGGLTVNELRIAAGLPARKELSTDENGRPRTVMSKNWGSTDAVMEQVLVEAIGKKTIISKNDTKDEEKKDIENEGGEQDGEQ